MRFTITRQRIEYIGRIWMPAVTCAQYQDLSAHDLANIDDLRDRDAVEHWLLLHSGDFQSITDFRADFHDGDDHIVHEWAKPESELTFNDCMYGSDE